MTEQTSPSTTEEQQQSSEKKTNGTFTEQDFRDELIETFKRNSILEYFKRKRRKEFLGRLKYGKRYRRTDDPGPF